MRRNNANIDWKSIRNLSSNENALNENLKDDRGTNTASLNESADEVERRMRSNREAYERGVAEARAIGENRPSDTPDGEHRDRKIKGTVTVSYSFTDPVRYSRRLIKPAYRCEGGGEVVRERRNQSARRGAFGSGRLWRRRVHAPHGSGSGARLCFRLQRVRSRAAGRNDNIRIYPAITSAAMELEELQRRVDAWIREYGVRYFGELTNMAILTEEVGELARVMARRYGDQSFKEGERDNLARPRWRTCCGCGVACNQTGVDLTAAVEANFAKKTRRDSDRHKNNPKL